MEPRPDERSAAPERVRIGAYAWCMDDAERILLTRISANDPDAGLWTLPGGGVEFGEHPRAAALRELEEETGLFGEIEALGGVDSVVYEPWETMLGDRLHALRIVYRVRIVGGELHSETDGTTDLAAWVDRRRLQDLPLVDLVTWALGELSPS